MITKERVIDDHISIINRNCRIEGSLQFEGHLIIEGEIDGLLNAESVFIERGGLVTGRIHAKMLSVSGYFEGEAEVTDTLTLKSSADMRGQIRCCKLVVEEGGMLNGDIKFMVPQAAQAASTDNIATETLSD